MAAYAQTGIPIPPTICGTDISSLFRASLSKSATTSNRLDQSTLAASTARMVWGSISPCMRKQKRSDYEMLSSDPNSLPFAKGNLVSSLPSSWCFAISSKSLGPGVLASSRIIFKGASHCGGSSHCIAVPARKSTNEDTTDLCNVLDGTRAVKDAVHPSLCVEDTSGITEVSSETVSCFKGREQTRDGLLPIHPHL